MRSGLSFLFRDCTYTFRIVVDTNGKSVPIHGHNLFGINLVVVSGGRRRCTCSTSGYRQASLFWSVLFLLASYRMLYCVLYHVVSTACQWMP